MNLILKSKPSNTPKIVSLLIGGAVLGAVASYYYDPARGRTRRALLEQKAVSVGNHFKKDSAKIFTRFKNKIFGTLAALKSKQQHQNQNNYTLNQRVRAAFGRNVSHAKAIHTSVSEGVVTLTGTIGASEFNKLVKSIKKVPGVTDVVNHLDVLNESKTAPRLQ